jgi:hypothetical protein
MDDEDEVVIEEDLADVPGLGCDGPEPDWSVLLEDLSLTIELLGLARPDIL